ncbi:MAG TPA: VWA-like domain-containing protein [Actinomycetota bacterium]|nr:VWA-like domain-containing protein [Actinomycetota bacterium]
MNDLLPSPQGPGAEGEPKAILPAARLWAVHKAPYLASALFAAPLRWTPGCETVAVGEDWQIYADPEVVAGLAVDELGRLLIHLTGHLLRDHGQRAEAIGVSAEGGGSPDRWTRCADAEINDDLAVDGLVPGSAPDLPRHLGCPDGGLAETYYNSRVGGRRRWDCGSGSDGQRRGWEGSGGIPNRQVEGIRTAVAAEIQQQDGQQPGSVPAGWLRWAEAILPSRVDWRKLLAAEVRSAVAAVAGCVDYTYRRPSRRARASGRVILPSLIRPVPEVAIVCDTSASMHDRLLARALAEVEAVLTRAGLPGRSVRVLSVDACVQAVNRVSKAGQVQLAGGGGTNMGAGIEAAAALKPRPSVVIVLTDGYTPWPEQPPPGVRVVVGLLAQGGELLRAPSWARVVVIEE